MDDSGNLRKFVPNFNAAGLPLVSGVASLPSSIDYNQPPLTGEERDARSQCKMLRTSGGATG